MTLGRPRLTAPEINASRGGTMLLFLPLEIGMLPGTTEMALGSSNVFAPSPPCRINFTRWHLMPVPRPAGNLC